MAVQVKQVPPARGYIGLLQEQAGELLGLGELTYHPDTVARTWSLSLARVRADVPAAEDLLALWAFLAPDDIPRSLPTEHAHLLPESLQQAISGRLAYNQVLLALGRYSLVAVSEDSLAVHRLVQAWVRARLEPSSQQRWAGAAVRLVWAGFRPTAATLRPGRPAPGCSPMPWSPPTMPRAWPPTPRRPPPC